MKGCRLLTASLWSFSAVIVLLGAIAWDAVNARLIAAAALATAERPWFTELPPLGAPVTATMASTRSVPVAHGSPVIAVAGAGGYSWVDPLTGRTSDPRPAISSTYRGRLGVGLGKNRSDPAEKLLVVGIDAPFQSQLFLWFDPSRSRQLVGQATLPTARTVALGNVVGDDSIEALIGTDMAVDVFSTTGRFLYRIDTQGPVGDIAIGDLNGDRMGETIVGGPGDWVRIYDGLNLMGSGRGFGGLTMGDISVAAGDVTGDGVAEIFVLAGPGAPSPWNGVVRVFDLTTPAPTVRHEVSVWRSANGIRGDIAVVDVTGDGIVELISGIQYEDGSNLLEARDLANRVFLWRDNGMPEAAIAAVLLSNAH